MNIVTSEVPPTAHPASSAPRGLVARGWVVFKELWCESIPLWFPFLSVGIAIFAVFFFDQTTGILQALIDKSESQDATEIALANLQRWHYWAFVLGLCLWSFANYGSTRLLHQFDYNSPDYVGRLSDRKGWLGKVFKTLEWLSPILAGIGPVVAVAFGFRQLQKTYSLAQDPLDWRRILALYVPCFAVALLVALLGTKTSTKSHSRPLNDRLSKTAVAIAWIFLFLIFLLVAGTYLAPGMWSVIGPAATLSVIATAFVVGGSLLVFWGGRWRVPLIFLTLLYCVLISTCNDNHRVRLRYDVPQSKTYQNFGIRDALQGWQDRLPLTEPSPTPGQKTPLFIVCAEGGGVRAAYWAARLLAYLEDITRQYPEQYVPFSSRVLAISGVSGGSLGAVTFTALLDAQANGSAPSPDWFFKRTANFLGRDQLSAPLASAAFIDFAQRFIPRPVFSDHDRAAGIEQAWEVAWNESLQLDTGDHNRFCRFDDDFRELWRHRDDPTAPNASTPWIPSLFLNGTSVELGGRIIASDCVIPTPDYPGAQDALSLLKLRDSATHKMESAGLRVSSAVNLSARFPGISPSGELPGDEQQYPQRVVDGGYYDNSGARTAWDNLVAVYYKRLEDPEHVSDIIPWIIVIRAGPVWKRQTPTLPRRHSNYLDFMPTPLRPTQSHILVDVLAPPRAFLNAWAARSGDSTEALKDGTNLISRRLSGQDHASKSQITAPESLPPLELVDYSAPVKPSPPSNSSYAPTSLASPTPEPPHHDPYVIELNLELDEKQIDPPNDLKTEAVATGQTTESTTEQRHKLLLPLGWMLPAKAREVMEKELTNRLAPPLDVLQSPVHDERFFRRLQETQLGRVLSLLHRERPVGKEEAKGTKKREPTSTEETTG
jgi:hypothetical protein